HGHLESWGDAAAADLGGGGAEGALRRPGDDEGGRDRRQLPGALGRQRDDVGVDLDEAVAVQRRDGLRVEGGERPGAVGDGAERARAALAKGALERPLLS